MREAIRGAGCDGGLVLAAGALSGLDCTGETGTDAATPDAGVWSGTFAEVWKGLDKGSLKRSEFAQPASKPAAALVRARRNAKRARETLMKSLMTQLTGAMCLAPLSAD
jgi:hypothetical protein